MLPFCMIVMTLHSEWRVEPCWVVSFPHHVCGKALDKVMVRVIEGCCIRRSAVLLFGHSVVLSFVFSVVRPFVHITQHRNLSMSRVNSCSLFAVVFLTQGQGLVTTVCGSGNCTLRMSSSFTDFMSVELLRKVSRSSAFLSPVREVCSTRRMQCIMGRA